VCGRMTLTRSGTEIAEYFALAVRDEAALAPPGRALRPRYNIAPSQEIPAILLAPGIGRQLEWMHWGLVPGWAKDPSIGARLFNARSETVATKPSFRSAFRHRRCLIAADGFYEWTPRNRGHQPYHFTAGDGQLLAFAGLFERWHGEGGEVLDSCTVLTTEANSDVSAVHHRMPVLLDPEQREGWLDPASSPDDLQSLLIPAPPGSLEKRPVSRYVNNARRDDPACLDSPPPAEQSPLFASDRENAEGGSVR
jgi:putative SOS response-associated peptidase YedK